jgi:GNAT superfamily N-acetyltransferase
VYAAGVFRWTTDPAPGDDPGVWVPTDDVRVPEWLRPFNGDVLVAFADGDDGPAVAAGVGRKQHDAHGHELAVVTEEGFRGQGFARRLVSQAARRVLADGAVPTYLHAEDNVASARTADASGFPDVGWRIIGLFDPAHDLG